MVYHTVPNNCQYSYVAMLHSSQFMFYTIQFITCDIALSAMVRYYII